jgi:hypothetical protein
MADMTLTEPFAIAFGGAAPSLAVSRGGGGANLVSFDPREVWQDSAVGTAAAIDIDLGASAQPWDVIALINTNAAPAAGWTITTGAAAYTTTSLLSAAPLRLPSEDVADATGPAVWVSATPQSTRLIRLAVTQPVGQSPLTIGGVVIGKGWKPAYPREPGTGRPPIDTGTRTRLDDGGLSTVPGTLLSGFKYVFGDLDPSELAKLWGLLRRRRTTEPMLLIEDPGDLKAEGVHFGTFTELESYERRDQSKSRWAMSFEDWV